jgi:beta-phosphoglucomutase
MGKYKVVLFDFDGVIGNTMEDNFAAWRYAFSQYGINIDKNEYFLLEGMSARRIVEHFLTQNSKSPALIDKIVELKEKYYLENNTFSVYEDVEPLLPRLKSKGCLLGLVSGGSYSRLSSSLKKEYLEKFDVLVTGDRVNNPKPHPEPYLNAAKQLGVHPSTCIAVENAPLGIQSAKAAQMYCVAVTRTLDKKYLTDADKVLDRITGIEELL